MISTIKQALIIFGAISILVACIGSPEVKDVEPIDEGRDFQIVLGILGEDADITKFDYQHGGKRIQAETKNGWILVLWRGSNGDSFQGTLDNRYNSISGHEWVSVRKYNSSCLKGLTPTIGCWEAQIGRKRFKFWVIDTFESISPVKP
jgi:hypothetical protein